MREKEVLDRLKSIISIRFDKKIDNEQLYNIHLLNERIGLTAMDLVILYLDVEAEFNIVIPQQAVIEDKFTTLNDIKDVILSLV